MRAAAAANVRRSVSTAADPKRVTREPNASCNRPIVPPGMSTAQLSMSIARTKALTIAAATTQRTAASPSSGCVTPAMKNAATPSCAIANAAAFQTDRNDITMGVERTTRTRRGVLNLGVSGMRSASAWLAGGTQDRPADREEPSDQASRREVHLATIPK